MIYKVGMLCKHFKGNDLFEKNIYRIVSLGVNGSDIDSSVITYSGDNDFLTAKNLVVYCNIFQNDKMFCREYEDISSELSDEKKVMFNQKLKVQPLTEDEIKLIGDTDFISKKNEYVLKKVKM